MARESLGADELRRIAVDVAEDLLAALDLDEIVESAANLGHDLSRNDADVVAGLVRRANARLPR